MAINKSKALELYNIHHDSMPVKSLKEVDILIERHAKSGHESVETFIAENVCDKIIATLRKRGFVVRYVKFQSNENWRIVEVNWLAEEFTQ